MLPLLHLQNELTATPTCDSTSKRPNNYKSIDIGDIITYDNHGGAGTGSSPEIDVHGTEPCGFEAAFALQVSSLMHVVKVGNRSL